LWKITLHCTQFQLLFISYTHYGWHQWCMTCCFTRYHGKEFVWSVIYEGKSLNNRNAILNCMKNYAQGKILFWDTKWLLSNMSYRGHDDKEFTACAVGRTTWPLHCQLAPWKRKEALFVFCGQRVWNLLQSTEEWRFRMETVVWVRGECMNGWKDFETDDKMSVMNTRVRDQLAWQDSETAGRAVNPWKQASHCWWNCCSIQHESWLCIQYCP